MKRVLIHSAVAASMAFGFGGTFDGGMRPRAAVAADGHKHDGEKHKLGRQSIGGYTVSVIMIGEVHAGAEVVLDIKLIDAKTDPKALRVWVGNEKVDAKLKTAGTKGKSTYHIDVKAPDPVPAGAKVWVEIETDSGTSVGSFSYADKHDHKH